MTGHAARCRAELAVAPGIDSPRALAAWPCSGNCRSRLWSSGRRFQAAVPFVWGSYSRSAPAGGACLLSSRIRSIVHAPITWVRRETHAIPPDAAFEDARGVLGAVADLEGRRGGQARSPGDLHLLAAAPGPWRHVKLRDMRGYSTPTEAADGPSACRGSKLDPRARSSAVEQRLITLVPGRSRRATANAPPLGGFVR